jgi:hypothetical protein
MDELEICCLRNSSQQKIDDIKTLMIHAFGLWLLSLNAVSQDIIQTDAWEKS